METNTSKYVKTSSRVNSIIKKVQILIDKECHACSMKVKHSRHDKNLRKHHSSHYTKPQIHVDWDQVIITNKKGVSVVKHKRQI